MYPQSLKPDQAARLFERLANKYGVPAPSRQRVDIVKTRTSNHTLPLAARSNGIGADQPGGQFDDIGQVAGLAALFDQLQCRIDPADGNGSQFERDAEGTRIRAVSH